MKTGQVLLGFLGVILIFFGFLIIILLNIISINYNFGFLFRKFINLSSLEISGLRYALYKINNIPNFTTSSAQINLPQGYFRYSVQTTTDPSLRIIIVESYLTTTLMQKVLKATATIDVNSLSILNLIVGE